MTYGQDYGQPDQYPQPGAAQQWPQEQRPPQRRQPGTGQQGDQGGSWQPEQYYPGAHRHRLGQQQQPPHPPRDQPWAQSGYQTPQGPPGWQQSGYGQQYPQGQPQQQPGPWDQSSWQEPGQHRYPQPHRRKRSRVPLYAGIAAVV